MLKIFLYERLSVPRTVSVSESVSQSLSDFRTIIDPNRTWVLQVPSAETSPCIIDTLRDKAWASDKVALRTDSI